MSFKVSFNSGTGHDDLDKENEAGKHGEPTTYEFKTKGEADAFVKGALLAAEVTEGWVDAWIEVKHETDGDGYEADDAVHALPIWCCGGCGNVAQCHRCAPRRDCTAHRKCVDTYPS